MDVQSVVLWGILILAIVLSVRLRGAWSRMWASLGTLVLLIFSLQGGFAYGAVVLGTLCLALFIWALAEGLHLQGQSRDKAAKSRAARLQRLDSDAAKRAALAVLHKTPLEVRDLEEIMDGW